MCLLASLLVSSGTVLIDMGTVDTSTLASCAWVCASNLIQARSAQKDIGGAGYIILISSRNAALSYFAVYMATW